jgi:phage shock protein PspC (stress-responsive transcriptional regulator)
MKSQLYRSDSNKVLGGVAGGLGEYFDVDPVIIRVIFFVSMFAWGLSLLVYIGLWIFVPIKSDTEYVPEVDENLNAAYDDLGVIPKPEKSQRKIIAGVILIVFGCVILLDNFFPEIEMDHIWPLTLVGLGGYVIYKATKSRI